MDDESLEKRLSAVERALTTDGTQAPRRDVERRVEELEEKIRELEAATQALRGYVGDIRSRDHDAEPHADTGLDRVQRMEFDHVDNGTSRRHAPSHGAFQDRESPEPDGGVLDRLAAWL